MSNLSYVEPIDCTADSPIITTLPENFLDRRIRNASDKGSERRQFGNSYRDLSSAGQELAEAIDAYKVNHRRRYITTDEMLEVMVALGYRKVAVDD